MSLFKTFFENNNSRSRNEFFSNSFIKILWPFIMENFKYEHAFKETVRYNPKTKETFTTKPNA